jgi:hypothetical protein
MRSVYTIGVLLFVMIICAGYVAAQQKGAGRSRGGGRHRDRGNGLRERAGRLLPGRDARRWPHPGLPVCHEDKLSGQCEYALFDAAAQLERAVAALAYLVNECGDDLDKHCSGVPAGEGRLLDCLDKNEKKVSRRCKQALKDTGLK